MGCGIFLSILLIFIGIWIWASNYGITIFSFYRDWPIVIVIIGIYIFIKLRRRKYWRHRRTKE
jgi:hypothetical protein